MTPNLVIDWTIPVGSLIGFSMTALMTFGALLRVSWTLQNTLNSRFGELHDGLTGFKLEMSQQLSDLKMAGTRDQTSLKEETNRSMTRVESDVRSLASRIEMLEQGQSEWIKTLRERTHEMSNVMQSLTMKVELLACGVKPKNSSDGSQ